MSNKFPEPVVGCFILNDKKEILLVQSHKWPGKWVVMGGHVEWGEHIADTAVREVKEELGLHVRFVRVLGVEEILTPAESTKKVHLIAIQVECLLVGEYTPNFNEEIQTAEWFPLTSAIQLENLMDNVKTGLHHLL